jgi:ABC-type glycerol-3-phosphate transport system substrate-binding protein
VKSFTLLIVAALLAAPAALFASGDEEASADEPMKITWMSRYADSWAFEEIEARFNVEIESNGIFENDREKRELMLVAGEQPDVGHWWLVPIDSYNDGSSRAIPKEWIRQYAPNIAKMNDLYPLTWTYAENPDNRDELLAINGISANTDSSIMAIMFRTDYAANVGMPVPGYEENKRALDKWDRVYHYEWAMPLEWYEDLLRGFRDGDPDGNGRNDTIPFSAYNNKGWPFRVLYGMFGVSDGGNRLVDGELVTWEIDPGMRDFLILMNKWYEEGLIDQEFVTIDRTKAWEKVAQGVVGSAAHAVYNYAGADYALGRPPNSFVPDEEIGTGAEVVMIPGPVGPTGIQGGRAYSAVSAVGNYSLFVGSQVSDEKLKKILEILNWTHGTDEGFIYFRYGKPGAHCDWEGEPWDSACILRDAADIADDISEHGAIGAYPVYLTADRTKFFLPRVVADFYRDWVLADPGQQYTLRPYRWDILNETGLADVRARVGATLETLFNEFFFKAITGDIDAAAEWNAYVADWRKVGGDDIIAELEKAPIVSEFRQGRLTY